MPRVSLTWASSRRSSSSDTEDPLLPGGAAPPTRGWSGAAQVWVHPHRVVRRAGRPPPSRSAGLHCMRGPVPVHRRLGMGDMADRNDQRVSDLPTSPLLKAKLRAPVVPDHYVRRPRLLRLLDEAVESPLTLVVAPAGVGKTARLAGGAAETGAATGWLSLDESDHDPSQLWSGVIAALDRLPPRGGGAGEGPARRPRGGGGG